MTEAGANNEIATGDFEPEQKRYLERFVAGLQIAKTAKGLAGAATVAPTVAAKLVGPNAAALSARDSLHAASGKLSGPETFKREPHPFESYERLKDFAARRVGGGSSNLPDFQQRSGGAET